uniref:Polygalacturonase n=1 Tax=Daucus carota subsp. sativus TaxID=79200 RepID=A0A166BVA7_DAUCS
MPSFLKVFILLLVLPVVLTQPVVNNVLSYGAIGDALKDDTRSLLKAWEATCKSSSSSATMYFPPNHVFLTHPLLLKGPCKAEVVNIRLSGLRFKDNPKMHIVLNGVQTAYFSYLKIEAPGHSPNTDGIHIGESTDIHIEHCNIGTGDDCISIGGGSKKLRINDIICGPGHGISIRSLGKHGDNDEVDDVEIIGAVFTGTTNGARIKTWQGGKGYARNIRFEHILCQECDNPIIINQFYCDHEKWQDHDSAVKVSNVKFINVMGTSKRETAVKIECSKTVPCEDIVLDTIHLRSSQEKKKATSYSSNARGEVVPKVFFN